MTRRHQRSRLQVTLSDLTSSLCSLEIIHEKNITPKNDIFIFGDLSYLQY